MKIMVGTANLNTSTDATEIRRTSVRLTKMLTRKQTEAEPTTDVFDLKRALQSAQAKIFKKKLVPKPTVRRDPLAEAKIKAMTREWKDR